MQNLFNDVEVIVVPPTPEDYDNDKYHKDFVSAEHSADGYDDIFELFDDLFPKCQKDYKDITELVITLDHLMWYHSERNEITIGRNYLQLRDKAMQWAEANLTGEALEYYYIQTN